MKKMKFAALLLPLMLMASLTGCGAQDKQYDEFCAKAADAAPLLLNSTNGKEIYASEKTRYLSDYTSVLALKTFTFQEKKISISWSYTPAEKWVSSTYVIDNARNKLAPVYGAEAYDATLKANVSVLEDGNKRGNAELTWKFHIESVDTVELSLQRINEKFVENDYKLGDLAGKNEAGNDIVIATRGIVTATYNPAKPADLGSGVFIQDGEYGLQIFSTKVLNDLWVESGAKVGDCIFVVGKMSLYNGIIELEPSMLEAIEAAPYNIAAPVTIDLANKTLDKTLKLNQSTLVTIANCTYKDGNVDGLGSHASINFTCDGKNILVYANYHLGETVMGQIKDLVATFSTETVTGIKGILTFYNDNPQIIPMFGADSFINPAPVTPVTPAE